MVGLAPGPAVSGREREVLALVARHLTNAEIADELTLSVRTVESHVSSLLRKLQVTDRRALARGAGMVLDAPVRSRSPWPEFLTSFVGREAEQAALATAVREHRLVTVTGPGGVGKTRLAVLVGRQVDADRRHGAWFVDLVHVTDPAMVVAAVAATIGVPEQQGRSLRDAVAAELAPKDCLLVIDNCEHLLEAVVDCVAFLLGSCPSLTVLATSRARFVTPYEWVLPVAGLSVSDRGGEAVDLFVERAAAADAGRTPHASDVAALCVALGGVPLAIELAAARYPTLGLDGIQAGFDQGLRSLDSGSRVADRHRSMHATIAWSYELLDVGERALLCSVSAFAAWFDVDAAAVVAGSARAEVAHRLGRLAEHNLLVVSPGQRGKPGQLSGPTRYRALELIRQFAEEQLGHYDGDGAIHERHREWCRESLARLALLPHDEAWCTDFDVVAVDTRAAIVWAERHATAAVAGLAELLAGQLLLRGQPAESQARYELAARHTPLGKESARLLRMAAGVAAARMVGGDALRLLRAAADEAIAAGDPAAAAQDLAARSILTSQAAGTMAVVPTEEEDLRNLREAEALAGASQVAQAAVAIALSGLVPQDHPDAVDIAVRAADLAASSGLPLVESAALDQMHGHLLARHDYVGAMASLSRRGESLAALPLDAMSAFQWNDYLLMASELYVAVGDLAGAAGFADQLASLPIYRQQHHLGLARRIKVEAMAGDLEAAAASGDAFLWAWERAGKPIASNLASTTYAVAMVHGLLRDESSRQRWVGVTQALVAHRPPQRPEGCLSGWAPTLDGLLELDRGRADLALERLSADVDDDLWRRWNTAQWRPWYAALWAEAAVLGGADDAADRVARARTAASANPIAVAMVDRSALLLDGAGEGGVDIQGFTHLADTFATLGCTYQARRTLAFLNSADRR